ncbi:Clp protease N-terminal domain-containing protein [Nocardia sp. NPDC059764]|uniref:Clp protease N-terminal domain-containing protein n=1 Tax=Nocardia sp. NPDC059764 TaxID=3346939 RepID=UPI00365CD9A9
MFERFTDASRRAIVLAQEEARALGHDWIGTEHLLLGVLAGDDPVAARVLGDLGLDVSSVRERIRQAVGEHEPKPPSGHVPFTPRSKKVLEGSLREAMRLRHNYIGPEHILLALIEEGDGIAPQILISLGAEPADIRTRISRVADGPLAGPTQAPESDLRRRIADLEARVTELERLLGAQAR